MSEIRAAGAIALFFALRCIVPLMITVAIGYLMNRLVDRWEAEEAAEEAARPETQPILPAAKVADSAAKNLPCWLIRNCDEKKRAGCPAHNEPSLPCWIARLMSEGDLPSSCPDCPIYDPRLVIN
jgi:hypothetical protein